MTYKSKIDTWIFLLVIGGVVFLPGMAIYHLITKGISHPATWILCGVSLFYVAVILILAYPVSYEIKSSALFIRSGLVFRYHIPLSSIEAVRPTKNPLSAPAWSLDRLKINFRKKGRLTFALISPENKESFLMELTGMAPHLERTGDELVRTRNPLAIS